MKRNGCVAFFFFIILILSIIIIQKYYICFLCPFFPSFMTRACCVFVCVLWLFQWSCFVLFRFVLIFYIFYYSSFLRYFQHFKFDVNIINAFIFLADHFILLLLSCYATFCFFYFLFDFVMRFFIYYSLNIYRTKYNIFIYFSCCHLILLAIHLCGYKTIMNHDQMKQLMQNEFSTMDLIS